MKALEKLTNQKTKDMEVKEERIIRQFVTDEETWTSRVLNDVFPCPIQLKVVGFGRHSVIFRHENGETYFATNRTANKVLAAAEGRFNGPFCLIEREASSGRKMKWIGICSL